MFPTRFHYRVLAWYLLLAWFAYVWAVAPYVIEMKWWQLGLLPEIGQTASADEPATGGPETNVSKREFVREGTKLVHTPGEFRNRGDRLTFHSLDGRYVFQVLENLAVERIGSAIASRLDQQQEMVWEVSGTVTEFRGSNYFFVTHAVYKPSRTGAGAE